MLPEIVERLQAAVRIESINPVYPGGMGEAAVQAFLAGELDALGCRVEVWEPDAGRLADSYPFMRPFIPTQGYAGRPNLVAWAPAADDADGPRAHLILNSHADTVAPADPEAWAETPLSGGVRDGLLYGLGAVDAKGCLLTYLGALRTLRQAGITIRRPVLFQSVMDEEGGGAGTLDCLRRGYAASAALVGEPTSLAVCPGSRGSATLILRVRGLRAHPGEGWRGVNAIRLAWRYVEALDELRDDLDRTAMHPLWRPLPVGHVWNLMSLSSGPAAPAVPDACELHYNVGAIGGERLGDLRRAVEAAIARVSAADPWLTAHPPGVRWSDREMLPALTDPDHPAVRACAEAGRALGEPVVVRGLSAVTDGRHLVNVGEIPAINFGPGDLHRCHAPDEALAIEELGRAMTWTAAFIARYCGVAEGVA